jgi:hypothetical protein
MVKNIRSTAKIITAVVFVIILALPGIMAHYTDSSEQYEELDTVNAINRYGFYLEEVSSAAGVDFVHKSPQLDPLFDPILPQIASMGASVSVCDIDKDGWNDFYVTNSKFGYKNRLYHNQQNGSFVDVAEKMGIADVNVKGQGVSMGAVWADYDNDGFEDVFLYRWGRPELFRNNQGKNFVKVTSQSRLPGWINANTAIWLDYNVDGFVDLFIGGYFPEDVDLWNLKRTKVLTESFEYSHNGGRNYLMKNNGDGTFTDVTIMCGLSSTRWTLAAGSADLNDDGYPELVIANDFGTDELYFNEEGKRFVETGSATMIGFAPKSGMNVSFGDVSNKGNFGIYISNITEDGILIQGNNFWVPATRDGKVVYENEARRLGIESGGWSYGAQFGDLNNDGFTDLYVANGYISGKKGTNYWYDYAKVTGGNKAIISDIKNWPAMEGRSHSGYQQNKIWVNEGAYFFKDASVQVITGKEDYDSRAVALADLWNRGKLDLIVANQNDKLLIYKNHSNVSNNWIAFELSGTSGNKSAINAMVKLYWNKQVQVQVVSGGIGFGSQNQRRVHFGMGKSASADSAVIIWPGGKSQVLRGPGINQLHKITEHD